MNLDNRMTVRMGYDLAITSQMRTSETTPLKRRGRNDIRVERQLKYQPKGATKMQMTKGERLVAEMLGDIQSGNEPILTQRHPFIRKVIKFMENRREWQGTATELLKEIGDGYTPPNTVTKLLNRYDYDCFYKRDVVIRFHRTNRKRLIRFVNYGYKGDGCCDSSDDGFNNGF